MCAVCVLFTEFIDGLKFLQKYLQIVNLFFSSDMNTANICTQYI